MPGWFDDMTAPVTAVALISKQAVVNYADVDDVVIPDAPDISSVDETPDDTDTSDTTEPESEQPVVTNTLTLNFDANGGYFGDDETDTQNSKTLKALDDIADDDVLSISSGKGTPTYSNNTKEFKGWSTEKDPSANSPIAYYYDGKQLVKSEIEALFGSSTSVTLYAVWVDKTTTSNTGTDTTPEITNETITPHNNRTLWEQMQYLIAKYVYDGDWSVSTAKYTTSPNFIQFSNANEKSLEINTKTANNPAQNIKDIDRLFLDFHVSSENATQLFNPSSRHHALIKVNAAYDARDGKNDDPLYIRIESEPAKNANGAAQGNSPQQIIININVSNLADGKRPLFFYYDGPLEDRDPVPVILNLNANFKGVLFMPEVPVVINGNGHTFEGFIVAKEFRYLSTSGEQVKYSIKGETDKKYSDNKIHINTSNGDV